MARTTLHEGWLLSAKRGPVPDASRGRTVPAAVPGSVHLDLMAAGLIPDPYLDRVEEELVWMHRTDWQYRLTFEATAAQAGDVWTWSSTAWTPSRPSPSTGRS